MLEERTRQNYMKTYPLGLSQRSFCIEFSLQLANADTVDGIRSALSEGIEWLSSAYPGLEPLLAEIEILPGEEPVAIWKTSEQSNLPTRRELSAWLPRACANRGEFERLENSAQWGLLIRNHDGIGWSHAAAIFVNGAEPNGEDRTFLLDLTRLAASAIRRIEKLSLQQASQRRQKELQAETLDWMENSADILWEATPEGLIRCRRVLNQRTDISQSVDRKNLRQFLTGPDNRNLYELLSEGRPIRHLPVHLPDGIARLNGQGDQLIVSAMPRSSDPAQPSAYIGTFTAIPHAGSSKAGNPTVSLSLRDERNREERRRVDNDNMLEGLRLLVDNRSPRENLKRLIELLCGNVGGKNPILVESGFDGQPRLVLPERKTLNYAAGSVVSDLAKSVAEGRLAFFEEGTREHQRICDAFTLEGYSVAIFSLPLRGQMCYLICTTDEREKPESADIAFTERFAFILRQALILRAEQAQLAQTAKMAALGQMSASIAHELKQPLNTISLATQNLESLLMMPNVDPSAVEAKLARVMSQVERASNVIDRMRRFGRKSLEESKAFNVREVIEGVLLIVGHVLDRQNIEIEIDLPPDLMISGDELQFEQVLMNVIQNAADAIAGIGTTSEPSSNVDGTPQAGKIRFRSYVSESDPNFNIIRMEDNGPGFSAAANDRAAEAFFTTKPAEHGTGLGLAICESIIRESGGRFTYGNYDGGGYVAFAMPVTTPPDPGSR